jgi:hypothetical protein
MMRRHIDKAPSPAKADAVKQAKTRGAAPPAAADKASEQHEAPHPGSHDLSRFAVDGGTRAPRSNLPPQLKEGIESLSGVSMDGVKVHYDSAQPAKLGAHAFAQGTDIHIAPGQSKHLAHEAWHVVQQAQGRVQPTGRTPGGVAINDDKRLESEADRMGQRALELGRTGRSPTGASARNAGPSAIQPKRANTPVQRVKEIGGALLSWEPAVGVKLARYAEAGEVTGKKYTGRSDNKAIWLADPAKGYDFSASAERPYLVTLAAGWTVSNPATVWMNFESEGFKGEAKHADKIIVKENEKGAYGIGKTLAAGLFASMTVAANKSYKPPGRGGGSKKKKNK